MLVNNTNYSSLNMYVPKIDKRSNEKVAKRNTVKEQEIDENASAENTNKKAKKKQPEYSPEQIKEQIERMVTQKKTHAIYSKARNGSQLSKEEAKYLTENAPALYATVKEAEKERELFRKEMESLNSKDAIDKLKLTKSLNFLKKIEKADREGSNSEVEKYTMFLNTIQNEYIAYTKTEEYKELPTKDEDDPLTNIIKKNEE